VTPKTHAKFCLPDKKESHSCIRIVTGDEKWIYFQNPKRKKSWVDPVQPSTSSSRPIASDGRRCCAFGGIRRVSSTTSLKPDETVNAHHQQLIKLHRALREKRLHYRKRHNKLIFLHDNATIAHVNNDPKLLGDSTTQLGSATPSHLLTRLGTFDYHLFSLMGHVLAERHFDSYEDVRKWLDE